MGGGRIRPPPALGSTSVARFLVKRIGLALITLILLSMIVFAVSSILPGNVGRAVLGPFATQESVDALNEQLGTNRSLFSQYIDWVQRAPPRRSRDLADEAGARVGRALARAPELLQARVRRLRHPRADLDPRWRDRRAPVRTADRQGNHDVRPLGLRDAGLRDGDRAHPRLRGLARLAAGDGAG